MKHPYSFAALTLIAALSAPVSWAGVDAHEYQQLQQAITSGEILPARQILDQVEKSHPGKIIEMELDRDNQRWVYDVKVLRADGTAIKLELNAKDGALLQEKR